jgi:hypothetical protein
MLIVTRDSTVFAWHEDYQQDKVLAIPDYVGFGVVQVADGTRVTFGDPVPQGATIIRAEGAA